MKRFVGDSNPAIMELLEVFWFHIVWILRLSGTLGAEGKRILPSCAQQCNLAKCNEIIYNNKPNFRKNGRISIPTNNSTKKQTILRAHIKREPFVMVNFHHQIESIYHSWSFAQRVMYPTSHFRTHFTLTSISIFHHHHLKSNKRLKRVLY